jgi:hypothetical protein
MEQINDHWGERPMFEQNRIQVRHTPAEPSSVDAFCAKIGVELPADYQHFLLEHNGVIFKEHPCFYIPEIKQAAQLQTLYGLGFETPRGTCLDKNYNYNRNYDLDGRTLAIGDCYTEGEGGLFILLITTGDDRNGVYACDLFHDEFYFEESTAENNTFKLADSFTAFVAGLIYPDEENTVYFPTPDYTYELL